MHALPKVKFPSSHAPPTLLGRRGAVCQGSGGQRDRDNAGNPEWQFPSAKCELQPTCVMFLVPLGTYGIPCS